MTLLFGIDVDADLSLNMTVKSCFTHKPMTEQVKILENFIDRHTPSVIRTKPLQAKVMSSVEESSLVEYKPIPSLDSTHEPSAEPRTSKERLIHPLEFPTEFRDFGNTLKYFGYKKVTRPSKEVSPKIEPSKEWLLEVKHSFEAI